MRRLALATFLLALAAPGSASAARFAIGVEDGADSRAVAQRIEARTGSKVSRIGPFALSVRAPNAASLSSVTGVAWVERIRASRRLMFTPNDPLAVRQWYLSRIHAFDAWSQVPNLAGVRVAILDSGIDSAHPELQSRIADGKSFVSSSWENDTNGHGTFVAGEIAAALNNSQGIAGVGFPAQLLVAKIVRADGTISPDAEAAAIRWAVDNGARVINMSFGGVRDPSDPDGDTYSPLEAAAVRYAVDKGVLVVAAVGNADNAPTEPWGYAGYPAALPHVLGVSAIARDGTVPNFSNRDRRHNDIAAPGEEIFSTLPRDLTSEAKPGCLPQGYSDCGPVEFRRGEGTSFSAPQVAGAAAVLFAVDAVGDGRPGRERPHAVCRRRGPGHGMRSLLDRPRRAHRLGPARRRERGPQAERLTARFGPLRGERRGVDRRLALGPQGAAHSGHTGLLGRPGGRLQDQATARAAPGRPSPRADRGELEPLPLEARHTADRRQVGRPEAARGAVEVAWQNRADPAERDAKRLVLPRGQGLDSGLGSIHAQVSEAPPRGAPSNSSVATSRIWRAGFPTTTALGGTSRTTTAPAPT